MAKRLIHSTFVTIRALAVRKREDGTYTVELPVEEMTTEQHRVLHDLFPNLTERVYELLGQEALLGAILPASAVPLGDSRGEESVEKGDGRKKVPSAVAPETWRDEVNR